jgi:hypothetical protein
MTETMRAVTATADVNNDDAMAGSPTPEELATARELAGCGGPARPSSFHSEYRLQHHAEHESCASGDERVR